MNGMKRLLNNEGIEESTNTLIGKSSETHNVYSRKIIDLDEATKRLRRMREIHEIKLNPLDSTTSCGKQGCYFPENSSAQIYYRVPFPVPSDEYKTEGVKILERVAPYEWDRAKSILRKIIENPYYASPDSKDKDGRKEFWKIKTEWEEIKMSILENQEVKNVEKEVDEIRRKIKDYRNFKKNLYWLYDAIPSLFPHLIYKFRSDRVLSPEEARREIHEYLENLRRISNENPSLQDYFTSIKGIFEKIIENYDSKNLNEEEIKEKLSYLLKIEQEIWKTLNTLESQEYKYSSYLQNINKVLVNIDLFINSTSKEREKIIFRDLFVEAHETAHRTFEEIITQYFNIPKEKIYSDNFLRALNEGFAMSFSTYYILSQAEKGFLPPEAVSYILIDNILTDSLFILFLILYKMLDDKAQHELREKYEEILIYHRGYELFGLEKIREKIKSIDFSNLSNLSPKELRTEIRRLRKEIGKNIRRVIGALKENPEFVVSEDPSRYDELIKKLFS
jgi:hypothetical protein